MRRHGLLITFQFKHAKVNYIKNNSKCFLSKQNLKIDVGHLYSLGEWARTNHFQVVIEPAIIRCNYFKSWFLIDLLSCLPYDIFYMFKHDDEVTFPFLFTPSSVM